MNESKRRFVDQLLAADPPSAGRRGRYEKEVRAMLEKTLSPRDRWLYLACAVAMVLLALASGGAAMVLPAGVDAGKYLWAYFVVTAVALLALAGLTLGASWRGVIGRGASRGWAVVGVAYIGLVGWLFLLMGRHVPDPLPDEVRVFGLILVIYAAVAWARHRVAQAEKKTAEKLLEIELRLAEIGEALEARPRPADPAPPPPGVS